MHPGKPSLIAAILLLNLAALAQPPAPETSHTTTIKVFSRETIVDVIVTDAKGNAIRGLNKADFTIEEDGKPQPVRGFGEFDRGFATETIPDANATVHSNLQASPATGPVNILFIDGLHLNFRGANLALQAVATYSARMPAGTQVAVFWLGVSGLHMLQGFTTDPASIQEAVSVIRTDIGSNLDCYQTDTLTIGALNQIATYVAGIKGRKNLVWMTPGAPVYLLRDGGIEWGQATACNDLALEPAALGGVSSVFTGPDGIQTPGLDMAEVHHLMDTYELFTAEQIAVSPFDTREVAPAGPAQATQHLIAEEVAEQSGGFATYNTNDLAGSLARVIDAGSHYYTVSYIPPHKDDSRYHHITINVDRPGLRLTYRRGYNAEQPKAQREYSGPELIKAALQGRIPAATQLIFQARLVPAVLAPAGAAAPTAPVPPPPDSESIDAFADPTDPKPTAAPPAPSAPAAAASAAQPKGKRTPPVRQPYDLLLSVPQNQIAYAPAPDGSHTVKLQFAFDAYDLNGKLLGAHAQNVALTLTPERYAAFIKAPVVFHEAISFFPGPLFLRIGVLDSTSNKVGTLEIPLTIPKH